MAGDKYAEAFLLMLYRNPKTGREEWLWNSRDGVTPFMIGDPEGGDMQHVEWWRDVRAPYYVPQVGSRIFVDMTQEEATRIATMRIDAAINDFGVEFLPENGREEAIADSAENIMGKPSDPAYKDSWDPAPLIISVTAEVRDEIRARHTDPRQTRARQ